MENQYNEENLKIMSRKVSLIKNDILPFIKEMTQILTVNDIFDNNYEIINNASFKTKFINECLKTIRINYELNQDNYNIENKFFDFKKKKISKNKQAKSVILTNIAILNNQKNFYVKYNFKLKMIINSKIETIPFDICVNISDISIVKSEINFYDYNKIKRNFDIIDNLYNEETINRLKNTYQSFINDLKVFQELSKNFKLLFQNENLSILLSSEFNDLTV